MDIKPQTDVPSSSTVDRGTLLTYGLFLLGNGNAIRRLAATPHLWLVGLLLTISAGLAREYDAEYLWAEPWHVLIAPVASFCAATALWIFVQLSGIGHWQWLSPSAIDKIRDYDTHEKQEKQPTPSSIINFVAFLGLFWMTAPFAWFYGIPYEHFYSAGDAAKANLWTLAVVALWRVVLMIRILRVLYGIRTLIAAIIVLLFGDGLMLAALIALPVPIIIVMGGVRLDGADQILSSVGFRGLIIGIYASFLLVPMWLSIFAWRGPLWGFHVQRSPVQLKPLVVVSIIAIIWWCAWLPITQPAQRLRYDTEKALKNHDFVTAFSLMETHTITQFPPHWDPPPRTNGQIQKPHPLDILIYLHEHPTTSNVQALYERKLLNNLSSFSILSPIHTSKLITLLERMPDARTLIDAPDSDFDHDLRSILTRIKEDNKDESIRNRITALLRRYPEKKANSSK